jgi:cellulose synthase/poly-beta-1,6-N-acetylglucosamine synthase-like glycosyltransferase
MSTVLAVTGVIAIALVALLVAVLLVQVLAGARRLSAAGGAPQGPVPTYCVLMPAHDEAGTIGASIAAVLAQLPAQGRLLVIADNCTDSTAAEARAAGAEVVERRNPQLRGKGHALAFGVDQLRQAPPAVVVIVDADCIAAAGALDLLVAAACASGRPAQAAYLMAARAASPLRVRMAAFAWAVRNQLRPLGMHRLGLPCQLMGSGMALPWPCIETTSLASGHLTEDLELGIRLATAGRPPLFCPQARVDSWFPVEGGALDSQRRRWEHGHLSMIFAGVPALLAHAVRRGSTASLGLALDLLVPPLALLAVLLAAAGAAAAALGAAGFGWTPAAVAALSMLAFAAAVGVAWWRVGRRWLRFAELVAAPWYIVKKLPVYAAFVSKRQKEWVRTGRSSDGG